MESLQTLARFDRAQEAYMLKGLLEGQGLTAFIADEETVNMAWHLGQAVGGIKVQVAEKDLATAREILASLNSIEKADAERIPSEHQAKQVHRALLAAGWGILLPPLQLYSIWIGIKLIAGDLPLAKELRPRLTLAMLLDLYVLVWVVAWSIAITR